MKELPLYVNRGQSQVLVLSEKRDLLLEARGREPERVDAALRELKQACVKETLRLTGVSVTDKEVAEAFGEKKTSRPDLHEIIVGQLEALDIIESAGLNKLGVDRTLLCEAHRLSCPPDGGVIRSGHVRPQFDGVEPSRPELIVEKLDDLSVWLDSKSLESMSPPEKATLAFIRLLEIAPFERGNFRLAHLLLSYFAYHDQFPPLFLMAEDIAEVRREIARALKFETKPLVDRLVGAQLASLEHCLQAVT